MEKVDIIINEITKLDRFKDKIVFYLMDKNAFVFDDDCDKIIDFELFPIKYEIGTLQNRKCLKFDIFDPNDKEPFNTLLFNNLKPISVNVQTEYIIEDEFKTK